MNCAIILASGSSTRFNNKIPKQFHKLNGRIILDYSVSTFSNCSQIDHVIIVVPKEYLSDVEAIYPQHKIVEGGRQRHESSYNGLLACPNNTKKVLIHDSARALVDAKIIARCIEGLNNSMAISVVLPSKDTLVETKNKLIVSMPFRDDMYIEQTPQGFDYQTILNAHENNSTSVTDDIRLVYEMGIKCNTVLGSENNFKITTMQDYQLAKLILEEAK